MHWLLIGLLYLDVSPAQFMWRNNCTDPSLYGFHMLSDDVMLLSQAQSPLVTDVESQASCSVASGVLSACPPGGGFGGKQTRYATLLLPVVVAASKYVVKAAQSGKITL